jgi:hypothetical protein
MTGLSEVVSHSDLPASANDHLRHSQETWLEAGSYLGQARPEPVEWRQGGGEHTTGGEFHGLQFANRELQQSVWHGAPRPRFRGLTCPRIVSHGKQLGG